jgi:thioredoxin 1
MELTRDQVDALPGTTLVEFGTDWCGYCQAARPLIDQVLGEHPEIRHVKVEDGKGRRLGRSFGVKLWPTLVVMHDGSEVARVVRPRSIQDLRAVVAVVEPKTSLPAQP